MKRSPSILFLAFLSLLSASAVAQTQPKVLPPASMGSAYGEKIEIPGVHNAGRITDFLYRGAQPQEKALPELKKFGITTIVDLRSEDPDAVERERKQTDSLGMRFVHIPVNAFSAPTNEQVAQFLSILRATPGEKVFVHCHYGVDRTGVFVATYRMAFEKWPAPQALKEMYYFGFNGFWHPAMISFVKDFPVRLTAAPALTSFKDSQATASPTLTK